MKLLDMKFENINVRLHVLYVFNMNVKFRSNWMLFTIRSINSFVIYNFRPQKLEIQIFD